MSEDILSANGSVALAFKEVMESTGFYQNDQPTPDVIEASALHGNDPRLLDKRVKYESVIDPAKLHATAIYELSGSPCIYFTSLSQSDPDPRDLVELCTMAWNQGLAPILWVVTPTKVLLYNSYAKPTLDEEKTPDKHLLAIFQQTAEDLRKLNEFAGRLQCDIKNIYSFVESEYFGIECKRIHDKDNLLATKYVTQGLMRFITGKYSPGHDWMAMIGFVVDGHTIQSIEHICGFLEITRKRTHIISDWVHEIRFGNHQHLYSTSHKQRGKDTPIIILHLFLALQPYY